MIRRIAVAFLVFWTVSMSFAQSEIRFESSTGGGGGAVTPHDILSAEHSDTLPASVTRGDLIVGNATPKWAELGIGANNRVLRSDGTDPSWAQVNLTTDVTGTLPIGNGGTGRTDGAAPLDAQFLVGTANATLTAERVCTSGERVSCTIGASTATFEATVSRSLSIQEEEFISGSTTSGIIGSLGWTLQAGTISGQAAVASHPGIIQLSSTTSSGTIGRVSLGTGGNTTYTVSDTDYVACLINPQVGTTTMSFRCGLVVTLSGSGEASQGVYWSFLPGTSANWRTVTRDGSGITSNTTAIAYAVSTWYFLEIKRSGSDFAFYLNNVLQFTHTANILTTTATSPAIMIETNEGVAKTVNLDYFAIRTINPLGARF